MKKIDIKGINPEKRIFHNIPLNVYPTKVSFEQIDFWQKNYRTILHIDLLEAEKKKPISELTTAEITNFLVGRHELRLVELADSIEKNGVKVPLIILTNGLLLDGNRRYFACSHIFHKAKTANEQIPEVLSQIPVWAIKSRDVDKRTMQKILAEANFVPDYKVPWTLDVKAKVIADFYRLCIRNKFTHKKAYGEIQDIYSTKRDEIDAYIETMKLTKEFISCAPPTKKNDFRELVQSKFLYFWEFRNKALKGGGALDTKKDLPKVKKLFFKMIETQRFKNFKQVEPMIKAATDKYLWGLLSRSKGSKINIVEAVIKEQKAVKSAEDKVRNFLRWLQTKADPSTFTKATFALIEKLINECSKLIKKGGKG